MVVNGDHDERRKVYAGAFLLDYALLVRDGNWEFQETRGRSLNNGRILNVIQPEDGSGGMGGRVFLGGADDRANGVLNLRGAVWITNPVELSASKRTAASSATSESP